MNDAFAGDIGDFGKFGLLRELVGGTPAIQLGVIWYYTGGDPTCDRHDYLRKHRLMACNPPLAERFRAMVAEGECTVACLEQFGILPPDTEYYRDRLNSRNRDVWWARALSKMEGCDLVFLDPDTGLEPRECKAEHTRYSEAAALWKNGHSLVIYQHARQGVQFDTLLSDVSQRLRNELPGAQPETLRYHRGTARAFIIIPNPRSQKAGLLRQRIGSFLDSCWGNHFDRV